MAPRLSRWALMTAVAAIVVALLCLTTGGTPLLFVGYGEFMRDPGDQPLSQRRIRATERSLRTTRRLMAERRRDAALATALAHTNADPLALRWAGDRLVPDAGVTAELAAYWRALPLRSPEVRTVAIVDQDKDSGWPPEVELSPDGRCVVTRVGGTRAGAVLSLLRASAGACILAEQFGLPGNGMATWTRTLLRGPSWDLSARGWGGRAGLTGATEVRPAWFESGARDHGSFFGDWRLRSVGRVEMACLAGRVGLCAAAAGVVEGGWPGIGPGLGYQYQRFPVTGLPRDLLLELGPAKFAEVWRSADPVADAYARATGRSMDDWVLGWARRWVGTVERDNGLSLLGGVGALLWLALLALLTRERLKQRTAT